MYATHLVKAKKIRSVCSRTQIKTTQNCQHTIEKILLKLYRNFPSKILSMKSLKKKNFK